MNKTKLEIIRIDEDVIATSGKQVVLCDHDGVEHFMATGPAYDAGAYNVIPGILYNANSYTPSNSNATIQEDLITGIAFNEVVAGQWFYYDGISTYCLCDGDDKHSLYQ